MYYLNSDRKRKIYYLQILFKNANLSLIKETKRPMRYGALETNWPEPGI